MSKSIPCLSSLQLLCYLIAQLTPQKLWMFDPGEFSVSASGFLQGKDRSLGLLDNVILPVCLSPLSASSTKTYLSYMGHPKKSMGKASAQPLSGHTP